MMSTGNARNRGGRKTFLLQRCVLLFSATLVVKGFQAGRLHDSTSRIRSNHNLSAPERHNNDSEQDQDVILDYDNRLLCLSGTQKTSFSSNTQVILPEFQQWLMDSIKQSYDTALSIPCPFFRRRAADAIDAVDMVLRFLLIRHKSIMILEPPGWRCKGDTTPKEYGIAVSELAEIIRNDWKVCNDKGYYITGRLSTNIYRDDCFFDGPDPDMPVRGLRKYLNAASQLFDTKRSTAELLHLSVHDGIVVAQWRLNGVLKLPWRPQLPELTGTTTYYTDQDGLIYQHIEEWDQSVLDAFLGTFWPPVRHKLESLMS